MKAEEIQPGDIWQGKVVEEVYPPGGSQMGMVGVKFSDGTTDARPYNVNLSGVHRPDYSGTSVEARRENSELAGKYSPSGTGMTTHEWGGESGGGGGRQKRSGCLAVLLGSLIH